MNDHSYILLSLHVAEPHSNQAGNQTSVSAKLSIGKIPNINHASLDEASQLNICNITPASLLTYS